MDNINDKYLLPTSIIDSDNEEVIKYARDITGGELGDLVGTAVKLYNKVRDGIFLSSRTLSREQYHKERPGLLCMQGITTLRHWKSAWYTVQIGFRPCP